MSDISAFVILKWLYRGIIWPLVLVLIPMLASVACTTDSVIGVMWCQCQWHHIAKKSHVASQFNCLDLGMEWCYWWHHLNHMMLIQVHMVSHDQKSNIAPYFNHLGLRNAVVPFMTQLASCDASASASGITWLNKIWYTPFQSPWLKKCNGATDDTTDIM